MQQARFGVALLATIGLLLQSLLPPRTWAAQEPITEVLLEQPSGAPAAGRPWPGLAAAQGLDTGAQADPNGRAPQQIDTGATADPSGAPPTPITSDLSPGGISSTNGGDLSTTTPPWTGSGAPPPNTPATPPLTGGTPTTGSTPTTGGTPLGGGNSLGDLGNLAAGLLGATAGIPGMPGIPGFESLNGIMGLVGMLAILSSLPQILANLPQMLQQLLQSITQMILSIFQLPQALWQALTGMGQGLMGLGGQFGQAMNPPPPSAPPSPAIAQAPAPAPQPPPAPAPEPSAVEDTEGIRMAPTEVVGKGSSGSGKAAAGIATNFGANPPVQPTADEPAASEPQTEEERIKQKMAQEARIREAGERDREYAARHLGDPETFSKLSAEEQNSRVSNLIETYAKEKGLSQDWVDDVKAGALNKTAYTDAAGNIVYRPDPEGVIGNIKSYSEQLIKWESMTPSERDAHNAAVTNFWENKNTLKTKEASLASLQQQNEHLTNLRRSPDISQRPSAEQLLSVRDQIRTTSLEIAQLKHNIHPDFYPAPALPTQGIRPPSTGAPRVQQPTSTIPAPSTGPLINLPARYPSVWDITRQTVVNSPALNPQINPAAPNVATAVALNALYSAPSMAPLRLAFETLRLFGYHPSITVGVSPPSIGISVTQTTTTPP